MIKLAGMVTLYNPSEDNISNISNYIDVIDKLYIFDNSDGVDNSNMLPKNKKIVYVRMVCFSFGNIHSFSLIFDNNCPAWTIIS